MKKLLLLFCMMPIIMASAQDSVTSSQIVAAEKMIGLNFQPVKKRFHDRLFNRQVENL